MPRHSRRIIGTTALLGLTLMPATAVGADLNVVVTIKPIHSLAAAVMAGVGEPKLLIDNVGSPHTYSLKPSEAKALNDATVVLRVSDGLEPFMTKIVKSLPKKVKVVTLEAVPQLKLYALRTGGTFEAHDDDDDDGDKKGGHGHGDKHGHGHGKAAGRDGHIWLDPMNAKLIAGHIAQVLATAAPEHAARLKANALDIQKRLEQLSSELAAELKPVAGKPYVVFHDAYQYFERRYGLTPVGSITISPDVPPSAKRLTELRRKIAALKAACVFAEPQFEPKLVETVVEGTKARRGTLDPLGVAIPAGPELYPTLLKSLARDLRACLAEPS